MTTGLARSVQTRLVRRAHETRIDPNVLLERFAAERLLYRLSVSAHAERFVLKGALMLVVWLGETIRPTRDADLLGVGSTDAESLQRIFASVCDVPAEPDGLVFDATSIRVAPIREHDDYGGQRLVLLARLGSARLRVQVDVGVGDAVVPEPEWIEYPSQLEFPRPRLRAYRPETTIAEKLHAMVELDARNSRLRDFFDIHELATHRAFRGADLTAAIAATFARRRTVVPRNLPVALTRGFAALDGKQAQWRGFVRRLPGTAVQIDLEPVIDRLAAFASAPLLAVGRGESFALKWPPQGPWQ